MGRSEALPAHRDHSKVLSTQDSSISVFADGAGSGWLLVMALVHMLQRRSRPSGWIAAVLGDSPWEKLS